MPHFGVYRGVVVDNVDPQKSGRVRVRIAAVMGAGEAWALPCVPYGGGAAAVGAQPQIGRGVWIAFEGGDPSYPVCLGSMP